MRRGAFLPARANVFRALRKENLYQHRPRLYNTDDKQDNSHDNNDFGQNHPEIPSEKAASCPS